MVSRADTLRTVYIVYVYTLLPNKMLQIATGGEQSMPPQDVLLWHVDHFELKAIKTQQIQEKHFASPLTVKKNLGGGLHQKEAIPRD